MYSLYMKDLGVVDKEKAFNFMPLQLELDIQAIDDLITNGRLMDKELFQNYPEKIIQLDCELGGSGSLIAGEVADSDVIDQHIPSGVEVRTIGEAIKSSYSYNDKQELLMAEILGFSKNTDHEARGMKRVRERYYPQSEYVEFIRNRRNQQSD